MRIPVVVGPTGIGKTQVAIELARRLDGEILVADSRQVYSDLHIATNHPDASQRRSARFHMIEVVSPRASYSAHQYVEAATPIVEDILARGRLPIAEGGTGLYVDALMDGFNLAAIPPNPGRRQQLEAMSCDGLVRLLLDLDPSARVDVHNPVRLVRAIELVEAAGAPLATLRRRQPRWPAIRIGLTTSREEVIRRLDRRVERQLGRGLVEETARAIEEGVPPEAPVMTGIGYAEAVRHLRGELGLEQLAAAMRQSNRRYAKRQQTWWRRDRRVRWFEIEPDPLPSILDYLREPPDQEYQIE